MPSLTIPERYQTGLMAIASLPDASFICLLKALTNAGPAETADELANRIEGQIPESGRTNLANMISAIAASQEVQRSAHVNPAKFASDTWTALSEDSPDLMRDIDSETMKSRISSLVAQTDIHLTAVKIRGLLSEVERAFCGARIMTDIRAAFEDDASKPPPGVTILHTLEIKYHDDLGQHREFYVALDDNDLAILKEAVERAEKKKKTLELILNKADLKVFD